MINRISTNNARRIPVRWFASPLRLIPVKKPPVPSLTTYGWLRAKKYPDLAAIAESCRKPIVTDELAM